MILSGSPFRRTWRLPLSSTIYPLPLLPFLHHSIYKDNFSPFQELSLPHLSILSFTIHSLFSLSSVSVSIGLQCVCFSGFYTSRRGVTSSLFWVCSLRYCCFTNPSFCVSVPQDHTRILDPPLLYVPFIFFFFLFDLSAPLRCVRHHDSCAIPPFRRGEVHFSCL